MLNPLRLLTTLLGFLVLATPIAAVAFFFVAITGSPGTCAGDEHEITTSLQEAASFESKWDTLTATLDAGQPASATFTESEVTSMADLWLERHDAPINEVMICFRDGEASASAKIDIPFVPGDVDVLATGTLIMTGQFVEADIQELDVGGLPDPLAELVEEVVNRVIEDQTVTLELRHDYALVFGDGVVTVSGGP